LNGRFHVALPKLMRRANRESPPTLFATFVKQSQLIIRLIQDKRFPEQLQKWEIGQKRPTGTALKLLHLVQKRGLDVVA
jgi:hypothetical protein